MHCINGFGEINKETKKERALGWAKPDIHFDAIKNLSPVTTQEMIDRSGSVCDEDKMTDLLVIYDVIKATFVPLEKGKFLMWKIFSSRLAT